MTKQEKRDYDRERYLNRRDSILESARLGYRIKKFRDRPPIELPAMKLVTFKGIEEVK